MSSDTPQPEASDALRVKLEELDRRKESAFSRKQEAGGKIQERIQKIGEYRKLRNDLTLQVRELKKQRDALNTQITTKITEIKASRPATKPETAAPAAPPKRLVDEKGRPMSPRDFERKIQQLEEKLETIPMSFEAEQKTNKLIKLMKKQLDSIAQSHGVSNELSVKSREIDALKRDANALHAKVTKMAKESQEFHEKMLTLSAEIEALKTEEEGAYQEFLAHKQEYLLAAGDVREQQVEHRAARDAQRDQERSERKKKEAEEQKTLQQRAHEASEKMRKGEKLTTEDLLALQSVHN